MVTATITSENGAAIAVSQFGVSVVHPEGITSIWARLSSEQRHALAGALQDREPGDEYVDWKAMYLEAEAKRSALGGMLRGAERDRDAAVERADRAEADLSAARARVEVAENAYRKLSGGEDPAPAVDRDVVEAVLAEGLHRGLTVDQLTRNLCAVIDDPPGSPKSATAVSRADIEKAVRSVVVNPIWEAATREIIDAVWALHEGTDRAVHVVRESDLAAVKVERHSGGGWCADGWFIAADNAEEANNLAYENLTRAVRRFAVQCAIEAEQAVDPVEAEGQTVRAVEDVARRWHDGSDHARDGSPFGGHLCNCMRVARRLTPMLAEAWDEGYPVGNRHNGRRDENPYRGADS